MKSNKNFNEYYNFLKTEIHNSKLASIKNTLLELFKLINNPSCSARELKEIVELDPPLTLRILKLANSAYYGTFRKLTDIQEAIVWLGFDTVKHLAMSMKVIEVFEGDNQHNKFSRLDLWKSSIATAIMGKALYRREFYDPGSFIYSVGLLHNIGVILLDQFRTEDYRNILDKMYDTNKDLNLCEKEILGFDHTELAADIMEEWGFPINLINTIKHHHNPINAPKSNRKDTYSIFLIDQILKNEGIGFADNSLFNQYRYDSSLKFLKLDPVCFEPILELVQCELNEMHTNGIL
ncbi:MAG: HDOD domain-containing protein [Candidatus Cloacimonetes bacterium]|jgi:HD-like signal output (HDOD) protein|nr:HDOD domain-containing protein [Candidatus Cloacimonadota bacterium]MDD4154977.1 HDOD domain-containing protein [Candidatus Cloacimonadota bacterium]